MAGLTPHVDSLCVSRLRLGSYRAMRGTTATIQVEGVLDLANAAKFCHDIERVSATTSRVVVDLNGAQWRG